MKKQSGFTLIELVIVIIILGILAATAVPKFVDLQGDARKSAMKGVKGALEGAATLTFSRAAIDGKEKALTGDVNGVAIVYGYPAGTSAALSTAAGLSASDWAIEATDGIATITANGSTSAASSTCKVVYTALIKTTSKSRPTINVTDTGC
jgi:MSHA pilin protein MshA